LVSESADFEPLEAEFPDEAAQDAAAKAVTPQTIGAVNLLNRQGNAVQVRPTGSSFAFTRHFKAKKNIISIPKRQAFRLNEE
jgi:hypothetical protein